MKYLYLIFLLICISLSGFSQGENNIWYFGFGAGLDFNSGNPVTLTNCSSTFSESGYSITVSDSSGNLLFYADDDWIFNRNHQIMPNGVMVGPGEHLQPMFPVKKMDEDSVWYIFSVDDEPYTGYPNPKGLRYCVVDMRLDGGLGDIPSGQKALILPGAELTANMLTGTRAANNKDAWIVSRKYLNSNEFTTYHITYAGIDLNPVISSSLIRLNFPNNYGSNYPSMMQFSPDGNRLVIVYDSINEFCQFNPSTGEITPMFLFKTGLGLDNWGYTAEFSVDNKFLYVTNSNSNFYKAIYQYDALKTDSAQFKQSETLIHQTTYDSQLGRGPDNKIYCTHTGLDSLDVISRPTRQGVFCDYQHNIIGLDGNDCLRGFVQSLQRYYVFIHHTNQCDGTPIDFTPAIWPLPDSIHWDFGDPASGPANFSFIQNPSHIYSLPGSYTVTLFVRHIDKRTDTAWQVVTVHSTYEPSLGADQSVCLGTTVTFDAGPCAGCSYQWVNLTTNLPVGVGQTFTTGQAGVYEVTVINTFGCIGKDTVQLITNPQPVITNNPLSKTICSGESTNIILTSSQPGANFYWTATLTSGNITGFSADSGLILNQILLNNGSTAGIVTYHITPKVGGCAGTAVVFPVTVNPGDSVKVSISASANNVCAGTPVIFTATPTNGGSSPSYLWKVNGISVGTNNPNYTYNPASGDLVSCILTSNILCPTGNPATSNAITMVVNENLPVSVSISASANPFCQVSQVTFTAIPTNGGGNPSYQWKVNGISVGPDNPVYTYNPASGDLVSCILTSNIACPVGSPATSNVITMIVNANLPAGISITASTNPFCPGNSVTFTSATMYGGPTPSYQWKVNGLNVGTNSSTYTYNPASGDLVSCILTSNLSCVSGNPATSNTIILSGTLASVVTFTRCFDSITTTTAQPFKLKGGIPLGGTYSGAGVSGGIFHPAIAGVGTHQITYTYTNAALCAASTTVTIVTIVTPVTTCGQSFTDVRDGKTYSTVKIGNQCWMASNLNYGTMIPAGSNQRDNCLPEKYCPNNMTANCGLLTADYQWDELMNYDESISTQGLCPPGWHIPSESDWKKLFTEYTNNGFAASPLKYSGFSGFNALLNGAFYLNEKWDYSGFAAFFWSSTAHGPLKAWSHSMNGPDPSVSAYPAFRTNAFSVRCLKDN